MYESNKMKQLFAYDSIKHVTDTPHNLTGHAVVGRVISSLKEMVIKQKGRVNAPPDRLNNALLTVN